VSERIAVWSLPGQALFARSFARALGCEAYAGDQIPACEVVHIVGMYDCPTFATTLRATAGAGIRVCHWLGPDAANRIWPQCLPAAIHVASTSAVAELLRVQGVTAEVVAPPVLVHAASMPFPPGPPVLAVYGGADPNTYGMSMVRALFECLPGVKFMSYVKGQFAEELMPQAIQYARAYLRLRQVEDAGVLAREYLAAGRRVVTSQKMQFASRVSPADLPGVVSAVRRALSLPMPDAQAAAYWSQINRDERFVRDIEGTLR
jgi:hypothetical protein